MYSTASYIHGPDRTLAKLDNLQKKSYYYLYNGHGDVIQIIDTDGNIVNTYDYDIWGNFLKKQETIHNPFTYFGQTYDETTGLYYLRARYYDPTTGRFTQQDPAEDGYNWYMYGNHNPVIYADYTGESISIVIAGITLTAEQIALIGTTAFAVLKYFFDKDFRDAFKSAINSLGKSIEDSITYAKKKSKEPPSKLMDGDKVKTPDSHPDEFKQENGSSTYTHKKTGWQFKKDKGRHGGEHWDASPTGNYGDYINVYPDGYVR